MMQNTIEELRDNKMSQSRSSFYSTHTKRENSLKSLKEKQ